MIDATVIPYPRGGDDIRSYMREPWRTRPFPKPQRYLFPAPQGIAPFGEWLPGSREAPRDAAATGHLDDGPLAKTNLVYLGRDSELPATDPRVVLDHLDSLGAERAILLPLTRGILPNVDLGSVICAATNDWLADQWLGEVDEDRRFFGTIRVDPRDPAAAVREIERWSGDPRMVQVAVPLEAHAPYGQRAYFPLWEAVAALDVPVAVRSDGGAGTDLPPSPNGYPNTFAEYSSLVGLNYIYHLTSLITEGVFDRLPNLRFVFTDGGHDLLMPLMWRMDMEWPISKSEVPWLDRLPSTYLADHVRFTTSQLEGPADSATDETWLARSRRDELVLFASQYPHWTGITRADLRSIESSAVLHENAERFYRLDTHTGV